MSASPQSRRYLLDTNVISETRVPRPNQAVLQFIADAPPHSLHLSVMTIGELRKGATMKRERDAIVADRMDQWIDGLLVSFAGRIVNIDLAAGELWGQFAADRSRPFVDTLLAATAAAHGFVLVTRNTADVEGLPVTMLNPWGQVL